MQYLELTYIIEKEAGVYSAFFKELGTTSCGDTIEEAEHNLSEAVELHLQTLEELGERSAFFEKRGIIPRENSVSASRTYVTQSRIAIGC